ncbi:hypothetical protein V6N12_056377 [Hibiscus sabdariffa]|uniref:Uncharacterized protein n=1 Tax=Hibiscus sabdariffa TaxID=183260 RepID=A0ABR2CSC9_9ROSI
MVLSAISAVKEFLHSHSMSVTALYYTREDGGSVIAGDDATWADEESSTWNTNNLRRWISLAGGEAWRSPHLHLDRWIKSAVQLPQQDTREALCAIFAVEKVRGSFIIVIAKWIYTSNVLCSHST